MSVRDVHKLGYLFSSAYRALVTASFAVSLSRDSVVNSFIRCDSILTTQLSPCPNTFVLVPDPFFRYIPALCSGLDSRTPAVKPRGQCVLKQLRPVLMTHQSITTGQSLLRPIPTEEFLLRNFSFFPPSFPNNRGTPVDEQRKTIIRYRGKITKYGAVCVDRVCHRLVGHHPLIPFPLYT